MKASVTRLGLNLFILALGLFIFSCEKTVVPEPASPANGRLEAAQGKAVFWTASQTLGGSYIEVFIGGRSQGRITSYRSTAPACGTTGFVTVSGDVGTYAVTAVGQDGTQFSGSVKLVANQCVGFEFKASGATAPVITPRGGNMTFWTSQSAGWSSISVWIDNVLKGTINGNYFTSVPACQSPGTVFATVTAGNHSYRAQSNTGAVWTGNATITDGQCLPIRLDFPVGTGGGGSTPTSTQVVFWTSSTQYGTISVYLNNSYLGTITKAYGSAPGCGTTGCVTAKITATNNTWYALNSAGRRWTGTYTLRPGCTALVLQ